MLAESVNNDQVKGKDGIFFPTGCSLSHVAAHYTLNPGDQTVLDLMR